MVTTATDDPRERAAALAPILAARAAEAEALRRLPDATIADLKAAGLHRLAQPRRFGGAELPLDVAVEVVAILAKGCGSTAWVTSVFTDHSILVGKFDPAAADDVWGSNADATISAGYHPSGTAERVAGGWRISGKWGFASGCDHADWLLLGSPLPGADGAIVPSLCLVPRREITIEDNWHVLGLAGTGSKNIVGRDLFVPAHRALSFAAANAGWTADASRDLAPLYRLPHVTTVPFMFVATGLGIAESLLEAITAEIGRRSSAGMRLAELQSMQLHIAESAAEIDCARMLVKRDTSEAMAAMRAGTTLDLATKARNRRDQAYAGRLCRRAVDHLFAMAGSVGTFDGHLAQRKFRDMCAASTHISMAWDISGTTFGRVAFGLDPATALI